MMIPAQILSYFFILISHSPHGLNAFRLPGVFLYLIPQHLDMNGQGLVLAETVRAPYPIEQIFLTEHLARILYKQEKQFIFLDRHGKRFPVKRHLLGILVDYKPAGVNDGILPLQLVIAPYKRADPGKQYIHVHRSSDPLFRCRHLK